MTLKELEKLIVLFGEKAKIIEVVEYLKEMRASESNSI